MSGPRRLGMGLCGARRSVPLSGFGVSTKGQIPHAPKAEPILWRSGTSSRRSHYGHTDL